MICYRKKPKIPKKTKAASATKRRDKKSTTAATKEKKTNIVASQLPLRKQYQHGKLKNLFAQRENQRKKSEPPKPKTAKSATSSKTIKIASLKKWK